MSQLVLGSIKDFLLDPQVLDAQLDEISLFVPREKKFAEDFDSFGNCRALGA